jgi:phosphogluconate dehydratase
LHAETQTVQDLRDQHFGTGRQLFAGFRSLMSVADRGASVFQ